MAQVEVQLDQNAFSCSFCLELLREPVTIPCGHSYCMSCINRYWEEEDQRGVHSCPQCKKSFRRKPVLEKNVMLAALVEQMQRSGDGAAPADPCGPDPERVACDFCDDGRGEAVMSCLVCCSSYCMEHLQPHLEVDQIRGHTLVAPQRNLHGAVWAHQEPAASQEEWLDFSDEELFLSWGEPEHRDDFLRHSRVVTVDPNTVNPQLLLSQGNRKVTFTDERQHYPAHRDRFTDWYQALSRQSLSGRCYWEVEWRGEGVLVAAAYRGIDRAAPAAPSGFGHNNKSWALVFYRDRFTFWYNNVQTVVSGQRCSRLGVFLDHGAGVLSFYRVSDTMTLLHRVRTTFTQPLYAGLRVYNAALVNYAEFCQLD